VPTELEDRVHTKKILVAVATTLLVLSACSSSGKSTKAAAPSSSAAPVTTEVPGPVTIQTGINDPKAPQIAVLQYMPAAVTVAVGETVRWSWEGTTEPHSATFFPPGQNPPTPDKADPFFAPTLATGPVDGKTLVNSGLQPLGPTAPKPMDLTFAAAGTYEFHCVIHPQMAGKVTVLAAGQKGDTPAAVKAKGDQEKQQWLDEGEAALTKLKDTPPQSTKNSDGSTTWKVEMGASTPHTDVLAFSPSPANLKAGDKVTFINNSTAPHTASFFNKQPPILDPTTPQATTPAPGKSPQTLNLTDLFNTGLVPPNAPPGAGPPEFVRSFTFNVKNPGTYNYICIFHSPSGMTGVIAAT
jgi:plastocyanin